MRVMIVEEANPAVIAVAMFRHCSMEEGGLIVTGDMAIPVVIVVINTGRSRIALAYGMAFLMGHPDFLKSSILATIRIELERTIPAKIVIPQSTGGDQAIPRIDNPIKAPSPSKGMASINTRPNKKDRK